MVNQTSLNQKIVSLKGIYLCFVLYSLLDLCWSFIVGKLEALVSIIINDSGGVLEELTHG